MTGFGAGTGTSGSESVSVEVKAVNHKFCEVKVRLPRELSAVEPAVVKVVKERLARGAVEVTLRRSATGSGALVPVVDLPLAQAYRRAFAELAQAVGIRDEVSVKDIASQPSVIRLDEPEVNLADAEKATEAGLARALSALVTMRETEGQALRRDLSDRLATVTGVVDELKALAPGVVAAYHRRLTERVAELTHGLEVDPTRIAQEVALFAERTDVAEELTRLASHLAQFLALLDTPEPAGRRMDFLVQEMHREINTTGSKSQHVEVSQRVVTLKAELERIREQVQNVE